MAEEHPPLTAFIETKRTWKQPKVPDFRLGGYADIFANPEGARSENGRSRDVMRAIEEINQSSYSAEAFGTNEDELQRPKDKLSKKFLRAEISSYREGQGPLRPFEEGIRGLWEGASRRKTSKKPQKAWMPWNARCSSGTWNTN